MAPQLFLDLGMGGLSGTWHLQRCIPYLGGQDEVKGSTPLERECECWSPKFPNPHPAPHIEVQEKDGWLP